MSGETIKRRLRSVPFIPFCLRLADGTHHAIHDAGSVEVVPRAIRIVDRKGRPPIVLCPRTVAAIEPL